MIEFDHFSCFDSDQSILKDINLSLSLPFRLGIIGQSGSGKSTFAKALAMLIPDNMRTCGHIFYQNQDLYKLRESQKRTLRRHHLKYLVQEPFYALNPYLKIKTQLSEVFDHKPSEQEILDALALVELDTKRILNAYPHQLSGGQRQRIALVQALLCHPSVLIADEPTTALDPLLQKQILSLIKRFLDNNKSSLVFVSHDIKATLAMTDHILVMKNGTIIESLPSSMFLENACHPYTLELLESMLFSKKPHQSAEIGSFV